MNCELGSLKGAYPRLAPVEHPETLIGDLEDAALRDGRFGFQLRGVTEDPAHCLADNTGAFVRESFDRSKVA